MLNQAACSIINGIEIGNRNNRGTLPGDAHPNEERTTNQEKNEPEDRQSHHGRPWRPQARRAYSGWLGWVTFLPFASNRARWMRPSFCKAKVMEVPRTPRPYSTLRLKLMDDASSKYFVGQEISPMRKPNMTAWAII